VLADLKKLRGRRPAAARSAGQISTLSMAANLMSGAFAAPERVRQQPGPQPPATVTASAAEPPAPAGNVAVTSAPPLGTASFTSQTETPYFRSVAQIGVQVADALAYAHKQGILHRDIKPGNLLLDAQGTVWITDFGLAKAENADELTQSGDLVGTLRYMAPERFRGWSDPRSDVYSLGITLYELLTHHAAFEQSSRGSLIEEVTGRDPPRPRKLDPHIPRDLETIVLKAIEKEPARRYAAAADLAEDLRRFLTDKPIQARRAGTWERARKWVKRRPAVAALAAALGLALLGLAGMWVWSYFRISQALARAEDERQAAVEAREREAGQRAKAEEASKVALGLRDVEAQLRKQADEARLEALGLRDAALAETYRATLGETRALRLVHPPGWRYQALQSLHKLANMNTAKRNQAELRTEAIAALVDLDARETLRLVGHEQDVRSMDFSPDGRTLATADAQGSVRLWDVAKGTSLREITNGARGSPDGKLLHTLGYPAVRFDPLNRYLAYAASQRHVGFASLRQAPPGLPQVGYFAEPRSLSLDGAGHLLAVGWADGHVGVHDASSGALKRLIYTGLAAAGVGPEVFASVAWAGQPTWSSLGSLGAFAPGARQQMYLPPPSYYVPVALSPDGTMLAVGGPNYSVEIVFLNENKPRLRLTGHRDLIRGLCFSPNGRALASCAYDHTARLWNVQTGKEYLSLLGHTGPVSGVAFSPDGTLVATVSNDQSARLWDARTGEKLMTLHPRLGFVSSVAFSRDGTHLAVANKNVSLFKLAGIQERRYLAKHHSYVRGLAFNPLKPQLATAGFDRTIVFWDLPGGQLTSWRKSQEVGALAFSGDGELLAVGGYSRTGTVPPIEVLNRTTGERRTLPGHASWVVCLAFDPAGKRLAAAGYAGSVALWDLASGELLHEWKVAGDKYIQVAFLDQGRQLLTATYDQRVVILDVDGGQVVRQVKMAKPILQVVPSPRGDRTAVLTEDGTLRLLSLPGLEETACVEKAHPSGHFLAISSDGLLLASGGSDRNIHLWDAQTLGKLCSLPPQNSAINNLAFDPEDHYLAVAGSEELVTLVSLGLLRSQLAAIGLDLQELPKGSVPTADLVAQKPAPAKVVQAPPSETANVTALQQRAASLYRQRKWADLVPVAQQAIEANPEPKELYLFLGQALFRLQEFVKSIEAYQGHLDRCKNCPTALQQIALCHINLHEEGKAIPLLERVLTSKGNPAEALHQLGRIHALGPMKYRDVAKAVSHAERAAKLVPDNIAYQSTLGRVYYRDGQFTKAVATLLKSDSPTNEGQNAANLLFLAMSYQHLDKADEAKKAYARALEIRARLKLSADQVQVWNEYKAEAERVLGI
jgi:WD40 repeat protein/cytochrome c-type biogenesis protein CcmH/NrfG